MLHHVLAIAATATAALVSAATCPAVLTASYGSPVVGSGWTAQLITKNLTGPRGIIFDNNGALLVVQQGVGILHMTFSDNGGTCLIVNQTKAVVENSDVGPLITMSSSDQLLTFFGHPSSITPFSSQKMEIPCTPLPQTRSTDGLTTPQQEPLATTRRSSQT